MNKKEFRSFENARKFVRSLKLRSIEDWNEYCVSGTKPQDIPRHPNRVYENKWKGLGDFLGTGKISNRDIKKNFLSYDESSKFCMGLGIKSGTEFEKFYSKKLIPKNIPASPPNAFHKIWKKNGGWGGFLGTGRIANKDRVFLSYNDAKKFVQKVIWNNTKIISGSVFEKWSKTVNRPNNIPSSPERTYKKDGTWISWGDFLGTGIISNKNKSFRSFNDARTFVHLQKLKTQNEWRNFCKSGKKPVDIPSAPHLEYKNKGWVSNSDWLGIDTIASQLREFRPFNDARKFVRSLKLKNEKEWNEYYKSDERPLDIPSSPREVYKNLGWVNLGDWLGTKNQSNRYAQYRPYNDAKKFVQTLKLKNLGGWKEYCTSGKKPLDVPAAPDVVYKNKGWINWGKFLGTDTISSQNIAKNYLLWKDAKPIYQKLKQEHDLKTPGDWEKFSKYNKKLLEKLNLPRFPDRIYTEERTRKMAK